MAKGCRGRRNASRLNRPTPYSSPSYEAIADSSPKKCLRPSEKKDWEDVTCAVCMECPHNAVLLLCSSHEKGCRSYMCGTSFRFSNCLDQYKTVYTKLAPPCPDSEDPDVGPDGLVAELACPLCRGQVKGWTVVEAAREHLNSKQRSCMQDKCSFVGDYRELRKHVRTEHPSARPREVDPALEQKWRRLEREREREDVISTITSSVPGAMVLGDYVIEGPSLGFDTEEEEDEVGFDVADVDGDRDVDLGDDAGFGDQLFNVVLLLHGFGPSGGGGPHTRQRRGGRALLHRDLDHVGRRFVNMDSFDEDEGADEGMVNDHHRLERSRRRNRLRGVGRGIV